MQHIVAPMFQYDDGLPHIVTGPSNSMCMVNIIEYQCTVTVLVSQWYKLCSKLHFTAGIHQIETNNLALALLKHGLYPTRITYMSR